MAATTDVKWKYRAEYLEYCNCQFGCPCNFSGFPDKGNCQAVVGYKILEGNCGDVDLAGATFVIAVKWPKAIHEGNGKAALFFDSGTSQQQMEALGAILGNQYGGLPHEILATTLTEVLGPFIEPIQWTSDGTKSSITIGDKVAASMTPFVSPVEPHDPQEVHVVLPAGFIFKDGLVARNEGQKVAVDGLKFSDKDTNAFYSIVEHAN
jgi:hypothetical protein